MPGLDSDQGSPTCGMAARATLAACDSCHPSRILDVQDHHFLTRVISSLPVWGIFKMPNTAAGTPRRGPVQQTQASFAFMAADAAEMPTTTAPMSSTSPNGPSNASGTISNGLMQ